MQRQGIRQKDIAKMKKLLAEGKSPAEVAEYFRCPVSTIESFFTPTEAPAKKPATKAKAAEEKPEPAEAAEA